MMTTVFITSSTDQSNTELAARLEQLVDQSEADTADLAIVGLEGMDEAADWTPGEPCPHCGGTRISVMEATEHLYESIEDKPGEYHLEYSKSGEAITPMLNYLCLDCERLIRGIPMAVLDLPALRPD
jgi:hypothetical protein